jgi:hypothetical protein
MNKQKINKSQRIRNDCWAWGTIQKNTRGLEKRAKFCPTAIIFGVYGGRSILNRDTNFLSSPDKLICNFVSHF